jgi:heptosyltransferase III
LIIRPGGIGDCILSLPTIEYLRIDDTEVWVPSQVAPLIRFAPARSIASTGLDLMGLPGIDPPPALVETLRSFQSIVSWYGTNRPEFRQQVRSLGLPFEFFDALPPPGANIHAADFFLKQPGGAGDAVPRIQFPPVPREDFVIIHPFSGSARKNWPLDRFRELAGRLNFPVRWCAGPEEALDDAEHFNDLYELGSWLRTARVYIGNDSGITHLAAAAGTPVVAIFGPTDPAVWSPRGARVRLVSADGLENVTVDQVLEAVIDAI